MNRDDIRQGIEELGVDLDEHIRFVIDALRPVQEQIGLNVSRRRVVLQSYETSTDITRRRSVGG